MNVDDQEELRVLGNVFSNLACYRDSNTRVDKAMNAIAERIENIVKRSNN